MDTIRITGILKVPFDVTLPLTGRAIATDTILKHLGELLAQGCLSVTNPTEELSISKQQTYGDLHTYHQDDQHPEWSYDLWQQRVAEEETDYGYHEWVLDKIEQAEDEAEEKEMDTCRTCGGPGANGDDAYDGECPDCADLNPDNNSDDE